MGGVKKDSKYFYSPLLHVHVRLAHPIGMLDIHNTIPLALDLHYRLLVRFMTARRSEGGREREKVEKKKVRREVRGKTLLTGL